MTLSRISIDDLAPVAEGSRTTPGALEIRVFSDLTEAETAWRALQGSALMLPHQSFEWIAAVVAAGGCPHALQIITAYDDNERCVFLAPLAIRTHAGLRILEWFCNGQGNYAGALFHSSFWKSSAAPDFAKFWKAALGALPRVDVVHLGNLPLALDGDENPLLQLPHTASAEPGRSFALSANWRSHYEARFSTSSRRELRRCERRLSDQGDLEFIHARDSETRQAVFSAMTAQKSAHFEKSGIDDFFADETIDAFYARLMAAPQTAGGPRLELFALASGGEIVATNMGLIFQDRFYGLISSITSGSQRRHAPGNILFLRIVEHLAEAGLTDFDCGAGTDAHKLRWCTTTRERFHAIEGLTPQGRLYAGALRAHLTLKRLIKTSAMLWPIAKKLRRLKGNAARLLAAQLPARA